MLKFFSTLLAFLFITALSYQTFYKLMDWENPVEVMVWSEEEQHHSPLQLKAKNTPYMDQLIGAFPGSQEKKCSISPHIALLYAAPVLGSCSPPPDFLS